jgi:GTPase
MVKNIRIIVIGNVDSGKSTTIGVLKSIFGQNEEYLDDGNGLARSRVMRYPHEIETGRTSTITTHYIKMDNSNNVLSLYDLAGHVKYLKTTIRGMTLSYPDYAMLMVGANMGLTGTAKEHLQLALSLQIPIFIVLTKIDIAPKQILKKTINDIKTLIRKKRRQLYKINDEKDITNINNSFTNKSKIIPFFTISNKNGYNVDLLTSFIRQLESNHNWDEKTEDKIFDVSEFYNVKGVGVVIGGIVRKGIINSDGIYYIGPSKAEEFIPVNIRSIHNDFRENVDGLKSGESGCFAIRAKKNQLNLKYLRKKKGVILTSKPMQLCSSFIAKMNIFHHHTMMKVGYEATMNCKNVKSPIEIIDIEDKNRNQIDNVKSNTLCFIKMRFTNRKQFINKGDVFLIREGTTRGIGLVEECFFNS